MYLSTEAEIRHCGGLTEFVKWFRAKTIKSGASAYGLGYPRTLHLNHLASGISADYANEITKYNAEFDVIVIDGSDRVRCARNSLAALKPNGVISGTIASFYV